VPTARTPELTDLTAVEEAIHRAVRATGPGLRIEHKWSNDWYVGTDLILCVGAFRSHVGVEFWRGITVPDPTHLLEGTGKNLRHVKVRSLTEAQSRPFRNLVQAAIVLDRQTPKRNR
jgi:hypothetical protein